MEEHGLTEYCVLPHFIVTEHPLKFFQTIGRLLYQTRLKLGVTHVKGRRQYPQGHDDVRTKPIHSPFP
jgi:hypothetical protein